MTRRTALALLAAAFVAPHALARRPQERAIDLTVRDADVRDVLQHLAREGHYNLFMTPDVRGKVTVHLEQVPILEAMKAVAATVGCVVQRTENAVLVKPR